MNPTLAPAQLTVPRHEAAAVPQGPRILYVVYWGLLEPLGQSLVVPALRQLAGLGCRITVVSFDKPMDLGRAADRAALAADLERHHVEWVPLRYHKRPRIPATAFDIFHGITRGVAERLRKPYDVVHARTYVGGLIGLPLARLLHVPLVYHNEGFYPDEQVDGGVWPYQSFPHRLARSLEHSLYAGANGIIALSHRARAIIDALPAVQARHTPTIVVPSCVDLDLFRAPAETAHPDGGPLELIYIGSIGYRYIFDRIARFVAVAAREIGPLRLRILTRAEPGPVDEMMRQAGAPEGSWTIASVPHTGIPGELAARQAGLFFLTCGISEHGCSPTKIGEYWAMGLPVVTTPNVSDTDAIVARDRVGVILREHSDDEYRRAARELQALLGDSGLRGRCRLAAETHYALAPACARQTVLYETVIARRRRSLLTSASARDS